MSSEANFQLFKPFKGFGVTAEGELPFVFLGKSFPEVHHNKNSDEPYEDNFHIITDQSMT